VEAQLKEAVIRVTVDDRSEKVKPQDPEAQLQKVPYMLVSRTGGENNAVSCANPSTATRAPARLWIFWPTSARHRYQSPGSKSTGAPVPSSVGGVLAGPSLYSLLVVVARAGTFVKPILAQHPRQYP
jgi:hypothetical protein